MKAETLEIRIQRRIVRKKSDVFLRSDFSDLGGYDQVGRVLRRLVNNGQLVRLGYGVYARSTISPISGTPMPSKGLTTLLEAVQRLGVEVVPTRMEQDYNGGQSTQIPTGRVVGIKGRLRRKLGYNGITLSFENDFG